MTPARLKYLILLALLAAAAPARDAAAQAFAAGGAVGFTLPMSSNALADEVTYKDLYKQKLSGFGQFRYLVMSHVSAVVEGGYAQLKADPEKLKQVGNIGMLELAGGDLTQIRVSGGLAWESNKEEGPNIVVKALGSYFRSTPGKVTLTDPESGEMFTQEFTTVNDIGLTGGFGAEIPVKPTMAIFAGTDVDVLLKSDLFSEQGSETLINLSVRAGMVLYF